MSPRRITALARYALATNTRTPYTWVGGVLLLAMTALGLWGSARGGDGWVVDLSMTFDGALLAAMFGLRSGLIAQRTGGLQTYLRMNFASPVEHMAGAMVALLVSWLLVCAALFLVVLVLPGGGPAEAAWQAAFFAVRTGPLLPFVIVAESTTTIDIPFFLPAMAFMGILMILVFTMGEVEAMTALAPPTQPGVFGSLTPSVVRVAWVWVVGFGGIIGVVWARARFRGRAPLRP